MTPGRGCQRVLLGVESYVSGGKGTEREKEREEGEAVAGSIRRGW